MEQEKKQALLLVWGNASWHDSQRVRSWVKEHNPKVKEEGGVRIVLCFLPVKSPWLNPIEPRWLHGKRAVGEPGRRLLGSELVRRLCAHSDCPLLPPLSKQAP